MIHSNAHHTVAAEEKKAKIRALKLAAKEKRAKRAAEIDPFSAQAALLKTSGQQAIQLWDFILKHTSVEFSDMEKKNLRLTGKFFQVSHESYEAISGSYVFRS